MYFNIARWSSMVARQAHNLKVIGSNPIPASNFRKPLDEWFFCVRGLELNQWFITKVATASFWEV